MAARRQNRQARKLLFPLHVSIDSRAPRRTGGLSERKWRSVDILQHGSPSLSGVPPLRTAERSLLALTCNTPLPSLFRPLHLQRLSADARKEPNVGFNKNLYRLVIFKAGAGGKHWKTHHFHSPSALCFEYLPAVSTSSRIAILTGYSMFFTLIFFGGLQTHQGEAKSSGWWLIFHACLFLSFSSLSGSSAYYLLFIRPL